MKKELIFQFFLFILLAFLQICLFNNIHLFQVATPLVYVYSLLKLPAQMNRSIVLLLSIIAGLAVDIFGYTLGLNMLAMTVVGFLRYYFLKLYAPRDIFENYLPSFTILGKSVFIRYASSITLIHAIIIYSIESLSLFDPLTLVLRIFSSFILTILLIFAFESLKFDMFGK
jgi:rod shape-determining protein MreD